MNKESKVAKLGSKRPRVDETVLEQLIEAKESALMLSIAAQEADLKYRHLTAQACRAWKQPLDRSVICLSCGLIRPVTVERCPSCIG